MLIAIGIPQKTINTIYITKSIGLIKIGTILSVIHEKQDSNAHIPLLYAKIVRYCILARVEAIQHGRKVFNKPKYGNT
jgi:hypothetical protein